jgi:hypothetical protein
LQRGQKNSGKSVANRQKQHFAKMRQRLQDGYSNLHSKATFRPSFLFQGNSSLATGIIPFGLDARQQLEHSGGRQTRLEEYRSTAPLVHRLASMKGRPTTDVHSKNKVEAETRMCFEQARSITERQTYSAGPKLQAQNPHVVKRPTNSNQTLSGSTRTTRRVQLSIEVEPLEASKKRLLQQSDWVGLSSSQPLQMQFFSRLDKERIGKRRRINHEIEARRAAFREEKGLDRRNRAVIPAKTLLSCALGSIPESSVGVRDDALASQMIEPANGAIETSEPQLAFASLRQSSDTMLFDIGQAMRVKCVSDGLEQEGGASGVSEESEEEERVIEELFGTEAFLIQQPSPTQQYERSEDDDVSFEKETSRNLNPDVIYGDGIEQLLDQIHAADPSYDRNKVSQATRKSLSASYQNDVQPLRLIFDSSPAEYASQQYITSAPERDDVTGPPSVVEESNYVLPHVREFSSLPSMEVVSSTNCSGAVHSWSPDEWMWRKFLSAPTSVSGISNVDSQYGHASNHAMVPSDHTPFVAHSSTVVDQEATQNRYDIASSVRVTQSPSASLRNIVTLSAVRPMNRTVSSGSSKTNEEELWRRFVFGDEKESTPLPEPHDQNITQPSKHIALSSTTSLLVGTPTSSPINSNDPIVEKRFESDQHGPHGCFSTPEQSADRSDHELNKSQW